MVWSGAFSVPQLEANEALQTSANFSGNHRPEVLYNCMLSFPSLLPFCCHFFSVIAYFICFCHHFLHVLNDNVRAYMRRRTAVFALQSARDCLSVLSRGCRHFLSPAFTVAQDGAVLRSISRLKSMHFFSCYFSLSSFAHSSLFLISQR